MPCGARGTPGRSLTDWLTLPHRPAHNRVRLRPLASSPALDEQSSTWKEVRAVSAPTRQQQHLLNIDEAAAYLNVPARWVADAVRQHKVRCTRIGKHVRFRIEHL